MNGRPNTKRNRRWWALVKLLSDEEGLPQERAEALAWKALRTYEETA